MNRVNEISSPVRPQTPQPPFPYHVEEVSFNNNDVHISGTLTYPENVENFPAVILIPGVGANERNNTFFGHHPSETEHTATVDDLQPNTVYYWKVIAIGDNGINSESEGQVFVTGDF